MQLSYLCSTFSPPNTFPVLANEVLRTISKGSSMTATEKSLIVCRPGLSSLNEPCLVLPSEHTSLPPSVTRRKSMLGARTDT